MIIPIYNEEKIIEKKLKNIFSLKYPKDKLEVIIVSDGSTDRTNEIVERFKDDHIVFIEIKQRQGKANALNTGIEAAKHDIFVFSDSSIMLETEALINIVRGFQFAQVGCISGEDYIAGGGGESIYGKYELMLRNLESKAVSIVGASGCFYAQRREICHHFPEGMAPDFVSVLKAAEKGYRSITEPTARGGMLSLGKSKQEFDRKIRTLLRGMTTLMAFRHLTNPFEHGLFAIELISHKIMRWIAGLFLISLFISNLFIPLSLFYTTFLFMQIVFYGLAIFGLTSKAEQKSKIYIRIPVFFCLVNLSALIAICKYGIGIRQEIWEPSKR